MNTLVATEAGAGLTIPIVLAYIVIFGVMIYFLTYRPNKKRQQALDALMASLEVGDSVLTTAGFYGVVIDIAEEVVVVEFGSDRHCRIPMQKSAIVSVEKANGEA